MVKSHFIVKRLKQRFARAITVAILAGTENRGHQSSVNHKSKLLHYLFLWSYSHRRYKVKCTLWF